MMARPLALACACAAALAVAPAPTRADPPDERADRAMNERARAHLDRGLEAYREQAYRRAAAEFRAGHAIDPHPDFLFPWAQAERLAGRPRAALALYRRVLANRVDRDEELEVRRLMDLCERELAGGQSSRPPGAAVDPAQAPPPSPPARPGRAWYLDPWGGVLLGAGLIASGTGTGFLIAAEQADQSARSAGSLDEFARETDRAQSRARTGAIALGVGGGLVVAAAVRYVLAGRADWSPEETAVSLRLGPMDRSGAGIAACLSGRF